MADMTNSLTISGIISLAEPIYLTCCENATNVLIDGASLCESLEKFIDPDGKICNAFGENYGSGESLRKGEVFFRYASFDKKPLRKSSKTIWAEASMGMGDLWVSGCYSEWTCGWGGFSFDRVTNELTSHAGRWAIINAEIRKA